MPNFGYKAGLQNVGSYQVSGRPYATGSVDALSPAQSAPVAIQFPKVTRWVVVANDGSTDVRVGFSSNGVSGSSPAIAYENYFLTVPANTITAPLELKLTELWLSGSNSVSVMAGLTYIEIDSVNNAQVSPSGSNWSGSVGV